jgi:hypothetical protein
MKDVMIGPGTFMSAALMKKRTTTIKSQGVKGIMNIARMDKV